MLTRNSNIVKLLKLECLFLILFFRWRKYHRTSFMIQNEMQAKLQYYCSQNTTWLTSVAVCHWPCLVSYLYSNKYVSLMTYHFDWYYHHLYIRYGSHTLLSTTISYHLNKAFYVIFLLSILTMHLIRCKLPIIHKRYQSILKVVFKGY